MPANPRFDRSLLRSARVPLTLIDGSTTAAAARDLQVLAAASHAWSPCHAGIIQRFAAQIKDGFTAAQAVANYTTTPNLAEFADSPFADSALSNPPFSESAFTDTGPMEPGQ